MAKWINCKKCGHHYHSSLSRCPECSAHTVTASDIVIVVLLSLVAAVVVIGVILGFGDKGFLKLKDTPSDTVSDLVSKPTESTDKTESKAESDTETKPQSEQQSSSESKVTSTTPYEEKEESDFYVSEATDDKIPESKVGAVRSGEMYYITRPLYYLQYVYNLTGKEIPFEDYAYGLTQEDIEIGFKSVTKNADGSATAAIADTDFTEVVSQLLKSCIDIKQQLRKSPNVESVESEKNEAVFNVKMNILESELSMTDATNLIALGLAYLDLQYHQVGRANEVTINVTYKNGETKPIKFPEAIIYWEDDL